MADGKIIRDDTEKTIVRGIGYACLAGTAAYLGYNPISESLAVNVGAGFAGYALSATTLSYIALQAKHKMEEFLDKRNRESRLFQLSQNQGLGRLTIDNEKLDWYTEIKPYKVNFRSKINENGLEDSNEFWGVSFNPNGDTRKDFDIVKLFGKTTVFFDKNQDYHVSMKDGLYNDNGSDGWRRREDVTIKAGDAKGLAMLEESLQATIDGDKKKFSEIFSRFKEHARVVRENERIAREQARIQEKRETLEKTERNPFEVQSDFSVATSLNEKNQFHFKKPNVASLKLQVEKDFQNKAKMAQSNMEK